MIEKEEIIETDLINTEIEQLQCFSSESIIFTVSACDKYGNKIITENTENTKYSVSVTISSSISKNEEEKNGDKNKNCRIGRRR